MTDDGSGKPGVTSVPARKASSEVAHEDRLALVDHAVVRLKEAGFELAYASMKSEACYYRFPGREGAIRVAAHRYGGGADRAVTLPVLACLTFGPDMRPASPEKLDTLVALAVGRYFLGNGSVARWRKGEGRRRADPEVSEPLDSRNSLPSPPPGWVTVPREPTPGMVRAAMWALFRWREAAGDPQREAPYDEKHAIRWRAMVEAAGTAPPVPTAVGTARICPGRPPTV